MELKDIIQVVETGRRGANVLLKKGYKIITVEQVAKLRSRRIEGKSTTYVHKDIFYVLGRTKDVEEYVLSEIDFEE